MSNTEEMLGKENENTQFAENPKNAHRVVEVVSKDPIEARKQPGSGISEIATKSTLDALGCKTIGYEAPKVEAKQHASKA